MERGWVGVVVVMAVLIVDAGVFLVAVVLGDDDALRGMKQERSKVRCRGSCACCELRVCGEVELSCPASPSGSGLYCSPDKAIGLAGWSAGESTWELRGVSGGEVTQLLQVARWSLGGERVARANGRYRFGAGTVEGAPESSRCFVGVPLQGCRRQLATEASGTRKGGLSPPKTCNGELRVDNNERAS